MQKVHSVKYNFIMNFILTASGIIFPLITFPYITRVIGMERYGAVSYVTNVINFALLFAQLGIPTYGVRACAKVRDDKQKLSQTAQEILFINMVMSLIVTVVFTGLIFAIPSFFNHKEMFFISLATFFLQALGTNWLFQALEQYDYITVRSLVFKIISIILMFILVHQSDDYIIYCAITVFAGFGSNVFNFFRARKYVSFHKTAPYNLRQHFKPIFILFAQSLAISIYTYLDSVMLGLMKGDLEVGYYTSATKIKVILVSLVTSLGNVLLPRMSYYVHNGMKKDFYKTMAKAFNFTLFMSVPLALFFSITASNCLLFLAGGESLPAATAMTVITLSVIPIGITNVLGIQVLTPLNEEKKVLTSVIVGAVIDFVLNLILIPFFGSTGASVATLVAEIGVLAMQMIFAIHILKRVKSKIHVAKYGICGIVAAIPLFFINGMPLPHVVLNLLLSLVVYAGIYFGILFVTKDKILTESLGSFKRKLKSKKQSDTDQKEI